MKATAIRFAVAAVGFSFAGGLFAIVDGKLSQAFLYSLLCAVLSLALARVAWKHRESE